MHLSALRMGAMKTKDAITLAGSTSGLAKILGITTAAICQWGENVPRLRVYELRDARPEWFLADRKRTQVTRAAQK